MEKKESLARIGFSMTVYDEQYGSENETGDFQEVLQWTNKEHGKVKKGETPAPAVDGALYYPACHNVSEGTGNIAHSCDRNVGRV